MCDLVKTKNCTYKSPNIIADYDKGKKLFTAEYIFIREKIREKKYQTYCQKQAMTPKRNEINQGNNS